MSKKEKLHPDFEKVNVPCADGNGDLGVILPKARAPVLARPGMAVSMGNQRSQYGVIKEITPDHAVILGAEHGETIVCKWGGEFDLSDPQPDPAFLPAESIETFSPHSYVPTTRLWETYLGRHPHEFELHDTTKDMATLAKVATITFPPDLHPETAKRIALLISYAPALFRELRDSNRFNLMDWDSMDLFASATKVLMEAHDGPVYEAAEAHCDVALNGRNGDEMARKLGEKQGVKHVRK